MKRIFSKQSFFHFVFFFLIFLAVLVRFSGITSFPPSLYWEEAALGYDAYSILQTGRDFHGHTLPLVAFTSFGDFKPSAYFYSLVPSIAVFGLTDFAVRFPSAVSGVLLVVIIGLISRELAFSFTEQKNSLKKQSLLVNPNVLQLTAMCVAALNPWLIQFSRGGWEVNEATMFLTFGLYLQLYIRRIFFTNAFDLKNIFRNKKFLFFSVASIFFVALSMYTYHATRLIAPILLGTMWLATLWTHLLSQKNREILKQQLLALILMGVLFTIFISPILISITKKETQQRFSETNLLADGHAVLLSNLLIERNEPHWLSKIVYHRYVVSANMILENYLKHFSLSYLFVSGDSNPRHSTQFSGLFYFSDFIFLFIGLLVLSRSKSALSKLLLFWLVIAIVPAALTSAAPHALRTLPSSPIWIVMITVGIIQLCEWMKYWITQNTFLKKNLSERLLFSFFTFALFVLTATQFTAYWRFYSQIYPKVYASEWQYGYKEMVSAINAARTSSPNLSVQISRVYGRPSTYYWFYSKTDPHLVQLEESTAKKDQREYLQFQNILFVDQVKQVPSFVASNDSDYQKISTLRQTKLLQTVKNPLGKIVWQVYEIK